MKIGLTFLGFILSATSICLIVAALGSLFFKANVGLALPMALASAFFMCLGIIVLRKCATLPISDERIHISHKLAR